MCIMSADVYADSPSEGEWERKFKDWFEVEDDPRIFWRNRAHGLLLRFDDKPVTIGHMLAVPWEAAQRVDDLEPGRHAKLMHVAQVAGRHLENVLLSEGIVPQYIGQLVAGAQVWHAHVHRGASYEGRDWIGGYNGQPRLDPAPEEWMDIIQRFGTSFDGPALDAELDQKRPPEDLVAMEQYALNLRDTRLAAIAIANASQVPTV